MKTGGGTREQASFKVRTTGAISPVNGRVATAMMDPAHPISEEEEHGQPRFGNPAAMKGYAV